MDLSSPHQERQLIGVQFQRKLGHEQGQSVAKDGTASPEPIGLIGSQTRYRRASIPVPVPPPLSFLTSVSRLSLQDLMLRTAVHASTINTKIDWRAVAEAMGGTRTHSQCMDRWFKLLLRDPLFWGGPDHLRGRIVIPGIRS
jgi:hypothetical protein